MIPSLDVLSTTCLNYLLDGILVSAVLVPVILIVQRLSRDWLSPAAKHAVWLILLLRLSVPTLPESPLSLLDPPATIPLPYTPPPSRSFAFTLEANPSSEVNTSDRSETKPVHDSPSPPSSMAKDKSIVEDQAPISLSKSSSPETLTQSFRVDPVNDPNEDGIQSGSIQREPTFSWQTLCAGIWLSGFFAIAARIFYRHFAFKKQLRSARPITDQRFTSELQKIKESFGIRQETRIYACKSVRSPALYGVLYPIILIPESFVVDASEQERTHVLRHELAHLKRRDSLSNLWTSVIQAIHWPNPFVWFAVQRIRGDRELAADDFALRQMPSQDPSAYGETILKTLETLPKQLAAPGAIGIAEDRMSLRRRFDQIAKFERERQHSRSLNLILMTTLTVTCLTQVPLPEPEKHIMEIHVSDAETGQPLPGVELVSVFEFVVGYKSRETYEAVTNQAGIARLEISNKPGPETRFFLNAISPENYVSQLRQWQEDEGLWGKLPNRHEFRLKRGTSIGGYVFDEAGKALENVAVQVTAYGQSKKSKRFVDNLDRLYRPYEAGIFTDKTGKWSCHGAPHSAKAFYLTFKKPGGAEHTYATPTYLNGRWSDFSGTPISNTELRKQAAQVYLPRGKDLVLSVHDERGLPILGAKVRELTGATYRKLGTTRITDSSGRVHFEERYGHQFGYIVEHPDYAVAHTVISPIDNEESTRITMFPKQLLQGDIIDPQGQPIIGAKIDLGSETNTETHIDWFEFTDRKGRFAWENAPSVSLFYRIRADGFATRVIQLAPSKRPHIIQMQDDQNPLVEHTTLVLNDETGEPIPSFEYSKTTSASSSMPYRASSNGNDGLIEDRVHPRDLVPKALSPIFEVYYINIRAPGFISQQSRPISIFETHAKNVIRMRPIAKDISLAGVRVLTPNGIPANAATAFLVSDSPHSTPSISFLSETNPSHEPFTSFIQFHIRTNVDGKLRATPFPEGLQGISVLSQEGSLAVDLTELDLSEKNLQLKPFGQIHGTLLVEGSSRAGLRIGLRVKPTDQPLFTGTLYTYTDEQGRFSFEKVPEGNYRLFRSNSNIDYLSGPEYYPQPLSIAAGEAKSVEYRIEGRSISGRLARDSGTGPVNWNAGVCWLQKTPETFPSRLRPRHDTFIQPDRLAVETHRYRNEIESAQSRVTSVFPVEVEPDGRFSATSIPPGDYTLEIYIEESEQQLGTTKKTLVAQHRTPLTVPAIPPDEPLDLGTVTVPTIPIDE